MLMSSDNKKRAAALLDHAKQLRSRGNVNQAVDVCRQALKLNPSNTAIHRHLALNLKTCQRYAEAILAAKKALAIEPDDPTLTHILDSLERRSSSRAPIGYVNRLFDRFATTFDKRMNGDLKYRVPRILGKPLKRIAKKRGPFKRAADLGCGTGLLGGVLKPFTEYLVGVDISQKMLQQASAKSTYDALCREDILCFLDQKQTEFDLIVAADVFIYIGDLTPFFRMAKKQLQSTGILAFSTEQTNRSAYRLRKSGRFAHRADYISELASQTGFSTISRSLTGIRQENNRWMNGGIFILEKCSQASGPRQQQKTPMTR